MTRVLMALAAAAVIMCRGGVNRVPLIDQEHCVVGILTRDDVVAAVARDGLGVAAGPARVRRRGDMPGHFERKRWWRTWSMGHRWAFGFVATTGS